MDAKRQTGKQTARQNEKNIDTSNDTHTHRQKGRADRYCR